MPNDATDGRKYVFVCGLHRSGTTLLDRNIAKLENCTNFKYAPKFIEVAEGQKLQDVYPPEFEFGGPGRLGFDPRAHLTESSPLLTAENAARLRESWHSYWDHGKAICVEKTPGNLLMTRFLQAAFPNSYFIIIRRHPVAVSMSTQRMWKVKITSLHRLFEHWLHCHELFEQDKKYLNRVYELSYEDYVNDPARYDREIAEFIGTTFPENAAESVTGAYNKKYLDRWCKLVTSSPRRNYYQYIAIKYEPRFAKYGYSLIKGLTIDEGLLQTGRKTSAAVGRLYCLWADVCAFFRRFATLDPKLQIKAFLPEFVLVRIWRVRHRAALRKARAQAFSS